MQGMCSDNVPGSTVHTGTSRVLELVKVLSMFESSFDGCISLQGVEATQRVLFRLWETVRIEGW